MKNVDLAVRSQVCSRVPSCAHRFSLVRSGSFFAEGTCALGIRARVHLCACELDGALSE